MEDGRPRTVSERMRLVSFNFLQLFDPPVIKPPLAGLLCALAILACTHSPEHQPASAVPTSQTFYQSVLNLYSGPLNHLEAVRQGQCPMHPSCSEYSRQAVARHGFAKGWMMSMDRLMRCGRDETRLAPKVLIDGRWKCFDPVDDNTF